MPSPQAAAGLFLLLCAFGTIGHAQTQILGTIAGDLVDSSGAAVPDAAVTLTSKDTNQSQTTTTNADGRYVFSNLSPGTYDVSATKAGFQQCVNTGANLISGAHLALACTMQVGAISQKVVVEAGAVAVETEDTRVSRVVSSQQMENMPVNGGNFATLLTLQPGVDQEFSFNSFQGMNIFATEGTHVNGLRGDDTALLIEGDPSSRTRGGAAETAPPPTEAIEEINIVSTGYLPEYARSGGGQVLVQIKSGTSTYHGSLYENLRNQDFDGRNFFSPTVTPLHYNNFGFTLGGPVIPHKNKVFFFYSSDWQRLAQSYTHVATVPTTLARSGNFSQYCNAGLSCPTVPAYLNGVDGLTAGARFPNDTIPAALFSANGAAMVNTMALPNAPGLANNNVLQIPDPEFGASEVAKVDVYLDKIKSRLTVTARHYATNSVNNGQAGSSEILDWADQIRGRAASADLTTTFSPTLLNDLSLTYSQDISAVVLPGGPGLNREALGINYPFIFGAQSKDIAGQTPAINVAGFDAVGVGTAAYPSGSKGAVVQLQDVVTKVSGQHTIKGGVWVAGDGENDHDQLQNNGQQSLNGSFNFNAAASNPNTTGAALADALLGNFDSYTEYGYRNNTPWRSHQFGFFGQDSWKVTKTLTISGGLRWDYFSPYSSNWCNFSAFDQQYYSRTPGVQQVVNPLTGQITGGDVYNGIVAPCSSLPASGEGHFGVFGQGFNSSTYTSINQELTSTGIERGLSSSIYPSRWNNWQPRLGLAWDVTGHGTTVIRAAAGIFSQHDALNDGTLLGKNVPFQTAETVYNGLANCPGAAVTAARTCATGSAAAPTFPIPISAGDLTGAIPQVYQWNANVQHQFFGGMVAEVGYVGTRARHLVVIPDLNELPLGVGPAALAANPGYNLSAFAPYPGFGLIQDGLNEANSQYDSLQVSLQKRMSHGLQFGLAYTYSHSLDDGSSRTATIENTYDLATSWGPSDFERKNILIFNYYYELPWLKNRKSLAAEVLGGWALGGVVTFETGVPYTVTDSGADTAEVNYDPGGSGGQQANLISGCNPNSGFQSVYKAFNTSCFALPAVGTFGDAGRNTVWGPNLFDWDLTLNKGGQISERLRWDFRAQFFNVLNHPAFGCNNCLDTGIKDSNFGYVTGANDPREIQLALRVHF